MANKKSTASKKVSPMGKGEAKTAAHTPPTPPARSTSLHEFHEQFSTCLALVAVAQHALLVGDEDEDGELASYAETVLYETKNRMEAMRGWLDFLETHFSQAGGAA